MSYQSVWAHDGARMGRALESASELSLAVRQLPDTETDVSIFVGGGKQLRNSSCGWPMRGRQKHARGGERY